MRHSGHTLIGSLIAVAIICILAAFMLPRYFGAATRNITGQETRGTGIASPLDAARNSGCRQQFQQVRQALVVYQTDNEGFPPTLAEAPGAASIAHCPETRAAYTYDAATGRVSCPTHGS